MLKQIVVAALAAGLVAGSAQAAPKKAHPAPPHAQPVAAHAPAAAAPAAPPAPPPTPWAVSPTERSCNASVQLKGPSGATTQIAFVSDGQHTVMMFTRDDIAEKAFLPLLVDHKPYSNLVQRMPDPKFGAMSLSPESLEAMRHGGVLQIDWLANEPITLPLGAADQGFTDLNTCGTQVYGLYQSKLATETAQKDRLAAEARAKTESDARLAALAAQKRAAEAQRRAAALSNLGGGDSAPAAASNDGIHTYIRNGHIVTCNTVGSVTNCF